jgi:hypothetical protein
MDIVNTYHHNLLKYKNIHIGETCYIFGSGPSFLKFKKEEEGIFIGCNHIIKNQYIKDNLKYYFFGHGYPIYKNNNSLYGNHKKEVDTLGNHIDKFCMVSRNNDISVHEFTIEDIKNLKNINALPCDINLNNIYENLENHSFLNHSIVFPATQFALYCGFSKIYLVGCDCNMYSCTDKKYFFDDNTNNTSIDYNNILWWKKMHEFKNLVYPNTKIININPVGLKNLMDQDIYT